MENYGFTTSRLPKCLELTAKPPPAPKDFWKSWKAWTKSKKQIFFNRLAMKIYLMLSPTKPWRVKIGITGNIKNRKKSLGTWVFFCGSIWLAAELEKALHHTYAPLNTPSKGNGGTEWFFILNPATAAILVIFRPEFWADWWWMVCFAPIPFDLFALLISIWAAQRLVYMGLVATFIYLVLNLK